MSVDNLTQVTRDVGIAATQQGPIQGFSKSHSGIGFEQGPSQFCGFSRDTFQRLSMSRPTGIAPSGSGGNGFGHLFGTPFNQTYQETACLKVSFIAFSVKKRMRVLEQDVTTSKSLSERQATNRWLYLKSASPGSASRHSRAFRP
mgnify:CR=1 FL=1